MTGEGVYHVPGADPAPLVGLAGLLRLRLRVRDRGRAMTACTKRRYRDEIAAKIALARVNAPCRGSRRAESRAYRCPNCKGWHLTSQPYRPNGGAR